MLSDRRIIKSQKTTSAMALLLYGRGSFEFPFVCKIKRASSIFPFFFCKIRRTSVKETSVDGKLIPVDTLLSCG